MRQEIQIMKNHRGKTLIAIIEAALFYCDAVGTWKNEADDPSSGLWQQLVSEKKPSITGTLAMPFQVSKGPASIDFLTGLSGSGKRVALFCGDDDSKDLPGQLTTGTPFVIIRQLDSGRIIPFKGAIHLIAHTPQQAIDFSVIAHHVAEKALCPVVLDIHTGTNTNTGESISLEHTNSFLGTASDEIDTPTEPEESLFGPRRRRIPLLQTSAEYARSTPADNRSLVYSSLQTFEALTGRSYNLFDRFGPKDASVFVLATGTQSEWIRQNLDAFNEKGRVKTALLRPNVVHPFPGESVVGLFKGKKAILVVSTHKKRPVSPLVRAIRRSFNKSLTNSLFQQKGDQESLIYAGFPTFSRIKDIPPVYTCYLPTDTFEINDLVDVLGRAAKHKSESIHFDLVAPSDDEGAATEEAPVEKKPPAPGPLRADTGASFSGDQKAQDIIYEELQRFFRTLEMPAGEKRAISNGHFLPPHLHAYRGVKDPAEYSAPVESLEGIQLDDPAAKVLEESDVVTLFYNAGAAYWKEKQADLQKEVSELSQKLTDQIDKTDSSDAKSSKRQVRIQSVVDQLNSTLLEDIQAVAGVRIAQAAGMLKAQLQNKMAFLRAVHIARLEARDQYDESIHDNLFAAFSAEQLNPDEAALFPPLLVHVDGRTLEQNDKDILFELLGAGLPIKILVTLDRTLDGNQTRITDTPFNQWPGQLAGPAIALNSTFVLQASASLIPFLQGAVTEGLRFDGPALFCVYAGSEEGSKQLHPFIQTAAALESRVFPTLLYLPGTGMEWASRFSIKANPQINQDWMEQEITYEISPGQTGTLRLPFTVAGYLACDRRFDRHFMWVPKNKWHPDMIPFGNYLKLDETGREKKIPIILMADKAGILSAVVVSAEVVQVAEDLLDRWRMLRELGGIENSFVKQALEDEQKWLAEQKQKAFEEAREQFETEWNRTTGELAQEIVSNIATGLLNRPLFGSDATPMVVAEDRVQTESKPTPPPTDTDAPADQEEEEEEMLSFDAAYIESPLCASCNECISINDQMFEYNDNDLAYIKDATAGTYRDLVEAAESCPEKIIHPGQPINPDEPGLDELRKRAEPFL